MFVQNLGNRGDEGMNKLARQLVLPSSLFMLFLSFVPALPILADVKSDPRTQWTTTISQQTPKPASCLIHAKLRTCR
jgi:hypothetical protein